MVPLFIGKDLLEKALGGVIALRSSLFDVDDAEGRCDHLI
jgi:hypothetical protein